MKSDLPLVLLTDPFIPAVIKKDLAPHARIQYVRTRAELLKKISKADGLITRLSDRVDEVLLKNAKKLKVVGNFAVGFNNIDLEVCKKRNIRVVNTPNVLSRSTAELAVALLFACAKRIPEGEKICRTGKFKSGADFLLGLELRGRNAVLLGEGRIGSETGRILEGIGIHVQFIRRKDTPTEIEAKLKTAQILSLHCPLNPSTRGWLNKRRISLLPHDGIVINTSRGPVVDEKALIEALKKKKIFSAGLDVYENEPFVSAGLRKLSNVVLLPHIGSATQKARTAMAQLVVKGVLGILSGQPVSNEVHSPS